MKLIKKIKALSGREAVKIAGKVFLVLTLVHGFLLIFLVYAFLIFELSFGYDRNAILIGLPLLFGFIYLASEMMLDC